MSGSLLEMQIIGLRPRPAEQETGGEAPQRILMSAEVWEPLLFAYYRSVKVPGTLWFLVRESAADSFTWSAWGWPQPPMESSSAWNVEPVSLYFVLIGMKGWVGRNVHASISHDISFSNHFHITLLLSHRHFNKLRSPSNEASQDQKSG